MLVGSLFCLLIPVVGGGLALLLVGYLNVRGLVGDALEGVATDQERRQIVQRHRPQMLLLGLFFRKGGHYDQTLHSHCR